jgi:uncharacterized LabA/DUF88 family protein
MADTGLKLRTVVFIDGQNMYKGAREAFGYEHEKGHFGNFRPLALARLLTQEPHRNLRQVRFYMGVPDPRRDRLGHAMAQRRLAAWQAEDPALVHHFTRTLRYPPPEGREKGVDVHLAVDLVALAIDNEYDLAVVASADTDLLPALDFKRFSLKMIECVAWEPIPECVGLVAAPLDSSAKGVVRRTIPKGTSIASPIARTTCSPGPPRELGQAHHPSQGRAVDGVQTLGGTSRASP